MRTPFASILMFLIASFLGALGQFLYKSGAEQTVGTIRSYLWNGRLLGGVLCYIGVMILFIAAFKRGGSLTVLYPIYAATFIWAAIISRAFYQTPIKPINIAGMVLLVLGMYFMGKS
jgi:drug/metabolite transporter (DMT)-like permease